MNHLNVTATGLIINQKDHPKAHIKAAGPKTLEKLALPTNLEPLSTKFGTAAVAGKDQFLAGTRSVLVVAIDEQKNSLKVHTKQLSDHRRVPPPGKLFPRLHHILITEKENQTSTTQLEVFGIVASANQDHTQARIVSAPSVDIVAIDAKSRLSILGRRFRR